MLITLLSAMLFVLTLTFVDSGHTQPAWQVQWEETIKAAEKEGRVVIYGDNTVEPVFLEAFQRKYPKIKVTMVAGSGAALGKRITVERRAEQYLVDVFIPGGTTQSALLLYPAKALDPIPPMLILPEVVDQSKWWQGKHHYVDPESQYIFLIGSRVSSGGIFYNTQLVDPNQIKSLWNLLDPKWKGKIVVHDPLGTAGLTHIIYFYHSPEFGPRFLKSLFSKDVDITVVRSDEQLIDWVAVGKFPIGLFFRASALATAIKAGLPVREFPANHFKEGAMVGLGAVNLSIMNRAPHPNAAKVVTNWFLSREGQTTWLESVNKVGVPQDPLREDLPKDMALGAQREPGGKYFNVQKFEFLSDIQPITDLLKKSLEEAKKQ